MDQTHPDAGVSMDDAVSQLMASEGQSEDPVPPEPQPEPQSAPQEATQGPAESDEPTSEDIPEEAAPEQPTVDAFELEIVHDGRQVKLNREDTIKLARQGYDYTQKTQAVAAKDRQVSEQLQRLSQIEQIGPQLHGQLAQVKALEAQLAPYQQVNWVQEASNDPGRYAQLRAQFDVLRDAYAQSVAQYQRADQAVKGELQKVQQQRVAQEVQRLPELVPEWKDQGRLESAKSAIAKHYQTDYGVNPQELDAGTDTAFKMAVLYKAMKYDQLVKSKADKSKTLRQAPPVTVPGSRATSSASADKLKQAEQRLRKSGSMDDAVAVLLNRQGKGSS